MDRPTLFAYAAAQYGAEPDYPWARFPNYAVLRHANRKWFAVVMDVPLNKLGLDGERLVSIVNLKEDPDDALFFKLQSDILPAYHMNKQHWISVILDGTISDDKLQALIDASYRLTR